jgi:hypothetical protein
MELILDFQTWRAGGGIAFESHENKIGEGRTELCNTEGFMCCLGQWALQSGFDRGQVMGNDEPADLSNEQGEVFKKFSSYNENKGTYYNTKLSADCMTINDDRTTTYQEKIRLLTERLAKEDIKLTVINLPS